MHHSLSHHSLILFVDGSQPGTRESLPDSNARIEMTLPVSVSIQLDVSLFSPSRCCHLKSGLYIADLNRTTNRSSTSCSVGIDSPMHWWYDSPCSYSCVFSLSLSTSADATVATSTCNSLCLALLSKTSSRCFTSLLSFESMFHVHFYSLEDFIHARTDMNSTSRRYEVFR